MIDQLDLRPDDRVLLLAIPEVELVAQIATRLRRGLLVGIGEPEQVHAARQATRDHTNVMFQPGSPDEIPWQNEYFSKVIDLRGAWSQPEMAAREVLRVLAPSGTAILNIPKPETLIPLGLHQEGRAGNLLRLRKP